MKQPCSLHQHHHPHAHMPTPESHLFRQIVSATRRLLRLRLQHAQGHLHLEPEIAELTQAIAVKQALLNGLSSAPGS